MDTPPLTEFSHTGTTYYTLLRDRAHELAVLNGRPSNNPSGADLAQARLEITERDFGTQNVE